MVEYAWQPSDHIAYSGAPCHLVSGAAGLDSLGITLLAVLDLALLHWVFAQIPDMATRREIVAMDVQACYINGALVVVETVWAFGVNVVAALPLGFAVRPCWGNPQ